MPLAIWDAMSVCTMLSPCYIEPAQLCAAYTKLHPVRTENPGTMSMVLAIQMNEQQ